MNPPPPADSSDVPGPVRSTPVSDARIVAAYRRHRSAYAAAAELGVGASTVYRVLRARGLASVGRVRFTPAQGRAVVRAFRGGATLAGLAERFAAERNKLRRALLKSGVALTPERDGRRSPGPRRPRVPAKPAELARVVELRARGLLYREIAEVLGRSVSFVSKVLRRATARRRLEGP